MSDELNSVSAKTVRTGFRACSVIDNSVIGEYFSAGSSPDSYDSRFDAAVKAFTLESAQAFRLGDDGALRYELLRPFIVKLMLYLGILPSSNKPMLIARLLENLAIHGKIDVNAALTAEAERSGLKYDTVVRALEKDLDPYNETLVDRVRLLTGTKPFTAKDMLCDLAVYVGGKLFNGNGNA